MVKRRQNGHTSYNRFWVLGAGKTTLINQALQVSPHPREEIIIIVNEFGEVGIDHKLKVLK